MTLLKVTFLFIYVLTLNLKADELHLTITEAKKQGFTVQFTQKRNNTKFQNTRNSSIISSLQKYKKNQIPWPFEFPYADGFIGNNFAQYQPYSIPGYHGGSDMVLERDSWIYAPVDGYLEAGHYAYTDNPDGSRIKHWKPWPAVGDPSYFELAVVDNAGNRFELHHVDKATLPQEIKSGLNSGKLFVSAGMKLGRVVDWSTLFHYDHVHINIHDKEGNWFNPEHFFQLLPDAIKPQCQFLAITKESKPVWLSTANANRRNIFSHQDFSHFIVIASDQKNNDKFSQVPVYFEIAFEEGDIFYWDFRKNLTSSLQKFADLRDVYPQSVKLPNGTIMRQPNGYYPNGVKFAVKLPMLENTGTGRFTILAKDMAGNFCEYKSAR